ncbi:hypothetical protein HMPREF1981_02641 [Bacteroides pyogenes F0041]|uniref:Uncharacterized protein n=1 Tax=Bacteroides pyogenes F0041 TaxID=1321819 RepID=U2CDP5_9BACE|nr:hypothetical protein HMPREF1981_02641 [Bacteroides pyogenes F0041]GAE23221.1 hypothetical protein JCM10003_2944 [Bacteroides pyogenes JCM 10003]
MSAPSQSVVLAAGGFSGYRKQTPGFQQVERKIIITSLQIHRRQHLTSALHKGAPAFNKKESQSQLTANTCLTTFCISSSERLPAFNKRRISFNSLQIPA